MKILIVDDFSTMRRIIKNLLRDLGFTNTAEAEDGHAALSMLQSQPFDFVVTDWNMPVMTGIEFVTALRAKPGGEQPKVVFCTTENDVAHIREAIEAGADEYVMKPFDHETLQIKLQLVGFA